MTNTRKRSCGWSMNKNQLLTLEAYSDSGARRTGRPCSSGPFAPTGSSIRGGCLSMVVKIWKPGSVVSGYEGVREPSSLAEWGRMTRSFTQGCSGMCLWFLLGPAKRSYSSLRCVSLRRLCCAGGINAALAGSSGPRDSPGGDRSSDPWVHPG